LSSPHFSRAHYVSLLGEAGTAPSHQLFQKKL
jgi:hypothetical protein